MVVLQTAQEVHIVKVFSIQDNTKVIYSTYSL